jgi:hypothetical protein
MPFFLPEILKRKLEETLALHDDNALYDLLVQPLHEALYQRNDFAFMDELNDMQQLLLAYDYLRTQVGQGGFIQFLVNGYAPLLLNMPEWLQKINANEMAKLIDDVLKVYVLNHDYFKKDLSVEAFGKLYDELKEFEELDKRYDTLNLPTGHQLMNYARHHTDEFVKTI